MLKVRRPPTKQAQRRRVRWIRPSPRSFPSCRWRKLCVSPYPSPGRQETRCTGERWRCGRILTAEISSERSLKAALRSFEVHSTMRTVAERLVLRRAAAAQELPVANLVAESVGRFDRDAAEHPKRPVGDGRDRRIVVLLDRRDGTLDAVLQAA